MQPSDARSHDTARIHVDALPDVPPAALGTPPAAPAKKYMVVIHKPAHSLREKSERVFSWAMNLGHTAVGKMLREGNNHVRLLRWRLRSNGRSYSYILPGDCSDELVTELLWQFRHGAVELKNPYAEAMGPAYFSSGGSLPFGGDLDLFTEWVDTYPPITHVFDTVKFGPFDLETARQRAADHLTTADFATGDGTTLPVSATVCEVK